MKKAMTAENIESTSYGYCSSCGKIHYLKQGRAREYCLELMKMLEEKGRIDLDVPGHEADPRLSLEYIMGDAMGQMFGVMECLDAAGKTIILKAFSGQYNGVWNVSGWAPPLLEVQKFDSLVSGTDKEIKDLGKMIDVLSEGIEKRELIRERKKLSQNLMMGIHSLYRVPNFRSEEKSLFDFFKNGIPTGAGDCCAPKLLCEAVKQKLTPISLAEIYWGRTNRSGTRLQGHFYTPCREKCQPVLGFMLCGIE
jgi:hypothetical protein